jgi:photosystem II stability/assembly factor-like uncharacterized protein
MQDKRCTKVIILSIAFLICSQNLAYANSDHLVLSNDMPRPFCLSRVCSFASGELWSVGGGGHITYISSKGERQERIITATDLEAIYFVNTTGWIVGTNGTIMVSTNNGKDWSRQISDTEEDLKSISCVDENHCWIVGTKGIVLRSSDGGHKWQKIRTPVSEGLHAISFITPKIGWAVGAKGLVIATKDGGISWNISHRALTLFPETDFATPGSWYGVKFVSQQIGWVAGSRGVAKTSDAGKTWHTFDLDNSFIGIVTQDGKEVWAIGRYGNNYHTQNSGKTWDKCAADRRK